MYNRIRNLQIISYHAQSFIKVIYSKEEFFAPLFVPIYSFWVVFDWIVGGRKNMGKKKEANRKIFQIKILQYSLEFFSASNQILLWYGVLFYFLR